MYLQQRTLNVLLPIFFVVVCAIGFPVTSARYLENSKNQLRENELTAVKTGSDNMNNQLNTASASAFYRKHDLRSILMAPRDYQQKLHSKFPLNVDLMDVLLEYEDEDRSKRFDDYGHMRFGKRGGEDQFDDYGHMRFGRSV